MKNNAASTTIKPGKLNRDELERMFANRPLEPYISILSATADFSPLFEEMDQYFAAKRTEICGLLEDSLKMVGVLRSIEERRVLKTAGVSITNQENLSVLSTTMCDIIVQNYTQMLNKLTTNCDYEGIINENLVMTSNVLLSNGVICYNDEYKGLYGGIRLVEKSPVALADKIKHQMSEIKVQIKDADFVWINEVLKTLVSQKAVFNNRLYKDIYDLCEAEGFISESQLKLHASNTQPTARIIFIRAAYNRLKITRAYAALTNRD